MRQPHVFISSRLALGKIRTDIRELLSNSGFSVEVYEKDSTPSTEPATYLRDIGHSDFVIFILDESYGTPRSATGKSGVHEEWEVVRSKGIPNHVYLKRNRNKEVIETAQKKFIRSELQGREISYFYYTSIPTLLQQIQKSIVQMSKLSHYEGLHTVGYAGDGPTIALPRKPAVLHRLRLVPPLPHDFYTKRDQLKNKIFEKWTVIRELVLDRYSRYGTVI
jgi:hypothetical protein